MKWTTFDNSKKSTKIVRFLNIYLNDIFLISNVFHRKLCKYLIIPRYIKYEFRPVAQERVDHLRQTLLILNSSFLLSKWNENLRAGGNIACLGKDEI